MLGSNQRPPPCKLGRGSPAKLSPVINPAYLSGFPAFRLGSESYRVLLRIAPVAARLQHAASEARSQHADIYLVGAVGLKLTLKGFSLLGAMYRLVLPCNSAFHSS
jgi:hypothetical protein